VFTAQGLCADNLCELLAFAESCASSAIKVNRELSAELDLDC
jgi:hypothetical protein